MKRDSQGAWHRATQATLLVAAVLLAEAAALAAAAGRAEKRPPWRREYTDDDFVFVAASNPARYVLARASRAWRGSMRTLFVTNSTEGLERLNREGARYQEHYIYWPDSNFPLAGEEGGGGGSHALQPKDVEALREDARAAIAPFLAHNYFGASYKWLLYGEDDTMFYPTNLRSYLARLDPSKPLALSDHLWFKGKHPNMFAPRCLPCHFNASRIPSLANLMQGYGDFLLGVDGSTPRSSPKVQARMAGRPWQSFDKGLQQMAGLPPEQRRVGIRYVPYPSCPTCSPEVACGTDDWRTPRCAPAAAHGGAGMVLSWGMMSTVGMSDMLTCLKAKVQRGEGGWTLKEGPLPSRGAGAAGSAAARARGSIRSGSGSAGGRGGGMMSEESPGGAGMLSHCLFNSFNLSITDPGSVVHGKYHGDVIMFSSHSGAWALSSPMFHVVKGLCTHRCRWLLNHALSYHVRGRQVVPPQQTAAAVYAIAASHRAAHAYQAFLEERRARLAGARLTPETRLYAKRFVAARLL